MSLVFVEKWNSRELSRTIDSATITLRFVGYRSRNQDYVYTALRIYAPKVFEGLRRAEVKCTPLGGGVWDCEVPYSFNARTEGDDPDKAADQDDTSPLGPELAFDITAKQAHVTQGYGTVASRHRGDAAAGPALSANAPDFKKAIGVTRDRVEGTDVFCPAMEFSLTAQVYPLLRPGVRNFRNTCAKVNDRAWQGYAAGEVIYLGCSGKCGPDKVWSLTHKFATAENLAAGDARLVVSPDITLPSKAAWDYVWCSYGFEVNAILLQTPDNAYVEQVYKTADFRVLGLGA
jgi:hypothetical protein